MSASSVTGKGLGTAMPNIKGPGNNRDQFVPILTPHIVASGTIACVGATATLKLPVTGTTGQYIAIANDLTTYSNAVGAVVSAVSAAGYITVTFAGTGTDSIGYMLIKTGIA